MSVCELHKDLKCLYVCERQSCDSHTAFFIKNWYLNPSVQNADQGETDRESEREKGVIEKTLLSLSLIHSCFCLILSLFSMRNRFLWGCKLVFVLSVWHRHEIIRPFPPPSDCQPSQECINNLLMRASKMHRHWVTRTHSCCECEVKFKCYSLC